jgi:hypothetical protein
VIQTQVIENGWSDWQSEWEGEAGAFGVWTWSTASRRTKLVANVGLIKVKEQKKRVRERGSERR